MAKTKQVQTIIDAAEIHLEEAKKNLALTAEVVKSSNDDNWAEKDLEYARTNLYTLIEKGQNALDDLEQFAREGGHPRAYEVLGGLIKALIDANSQLMNLHKQHKDITGEGKKGNAKNVTNNAIFVGTNAELSELMKQITDGEKK